MTNHLPNTWTDELRAAYPRKSGPMGWGSVKLMLELRRALHTATWEQVIDGCTRYKSYCQKAGKEGTEYVQSPLRFISDGCYLEDFEYAQPEDPKVSEAKRREAERSSAATARGHQFGIERHQLESVGAFETRIRMAETDVSRIPRVSRADFPAVPAIPVVGSSDLRGRITSLSERLRKIS